MENKKLESILIERKVSRLQLALKIGINPSTLYDCIKGKREFYPAYKKKIAEYLEVDEANLFDEA